MSSTAVNKRKRVFNVAFLCFVFLLSMFIQSSASAAKKKKKIVNAPATQEAPASEAVSQEAVASAPASEESTASAPEVRKNPAKVKEPRKTVPDGAVDSRIAAGRLGIGLNFPGIDARWFVGDKMAVEAKFQYEPTAMAVGPRLYYYLTPMANLFPYFGLEGAYVMNSTDKAKDSGYIAGDQTLKSTGFAAGGFMGTEIYVYNDISLQFDFGPVYVALANKDETLESGGIDFMINFGLTYYFGGAK